MYYCDIAIIGGGASSLAAAIEAARGGAFVYILERLGRVGKKLLATGNGRCNLSNEQLCPESYLGAHALISNTLEQFGDVKNFFRSIGLITRSSSEGHIYPASNTAASVLDALRLECARLGAVELCSFDAVSIEKGEYFTVTAADGRKVKARQLIFAAGGKAAPKFGTDGTAFKLLSPYCIDISPLSPALSPLSCTSSELRSLKGLRASVAVKACRSGSFLLQTRGEVQFAESALSGICVFDTAAYAPDELSLDLMPEYSLDNLNAIINEIARCRAAAFIEDAFTGLFQKRIAQCLLHRSGITALTVPCSSLSATELLHFAETAKDWRFSVGSGNWEKAQVTCGGIKASELSSSLELKKLPGVFVCGEALDVHGPCGGYNLHWAWASGRMAGSSALKGLI